MLKSDAQGFLIGPSILKDQDDILASQQAGVRVLTRIRTDVSAIARALNAQVKASMRSTRAGPGGQRLEAIVPAGRGARTAGGVRLIESRAAVTGGRRASATVAVVPMRDARGRFLQTARQEAMAEAVRGKNGLPAARASTALGGTMGRLGDAVSRLSATVSTADNLDPTVNAVKEVSDVVSPLGRGLGTMFGRVAQRRQETWYRRFLKALAPAKKPEQMQATGGNTNLLFGGGLLGGAGRALGGIAGAAGGLLKRGGKLLRRVPVLGALLAGGSALWSAFGGDDDPNATPEQNRATRYRNAGPAVGLGVGGGIGALLGSFLGPAGTLAGGLVGSIVGEKIGSAVGTWTKQLVDSGLPGKLIATWNSTIAGLGAAWDSLAADAKSAWSGITAKADAWWSDTKAAAGTIADQVGALAGGMNDWFKAKTGVDMKATAGAAWEKVKGLASDAGSAALDAAKSVGDALVPNTVKRAVAAGAAAAAQAKAGFDEARGAETTAPVPSTSLQRGARTAGGGLGSLIAAHEGGYGSFNRGAAGDSGGATMDFTGMAIGQIMAAQALPMGDANRLFAVGKYQVIPSTLKSAAQAMGLKGDEKFTPELQEKIFSEYLTDAKRPAIAGYIKGQHDDLAKAQLAGAQEWASIADPRTGKSYYAGSGGNKAGITADQFGAGLADARQRYKNLVGQGVAPSTAYAAALRSSSAILPAVSVGSLPAPVSAAVPSTVPAQIPEQPKVDIPERLNTAVSGPKIRVLIDEKIGQNVGDRGIAHIVTGGIGG